MTVPLNWVLCKFAEISISFNPTLIKTCFSWNPCSGPASTKHKVHLKMQKVHFDSLSLSKLALKSCFKQQEQLDGGLEAVFLHPPPRTACCVPF